MVVVSRGHVLGRHVDPPFELAFLVYQYFLVLGDSRSRYALSIFPFLKKVYVPNPFHKFKDS